MARHRLAPKPSLAAAVEFAMRREWASGLLAVILLTAGCADPTGPAPGTVSGEWGGLGARVAASDQEVVVQLLCLAAAFPAAVVLDDSTPVQLSGTVVGATWGPAVGRASDVRLSLEGPTLRVEFRWFTLAGIWSSWVDFVTVAGEAPTWQDGGCVV